MHTQSVLIIELSRESLAVARSLGSAGFHVIVGNSGATSIIESSRYCNEVWHHPPVEDHPAMESALVDFLDKRTDVRFIFPIGERGPVAISSMPKILAHEVVLVMVSPPLLRSFLNKMEANNMATRLNFNVPKYSEVRSLQEIQTFIEHAEFPIIVKPCRSIKKIVGRKAYILSSQEEFETVFSEWPSEHRRLIVQQYIEGYIEGCDFVASEGKIVGYFEAKSLRTDTPDGTGFSVDLCSLPISPDVFSACKNLAKTCNYTGAGLIQFIRSKKDNVLYFIEINPRLSAGTSQLVACGQNAPLLTLKACSPQYKNQLEEFDETYTRYRVNQRAHWLQGDIEGFLSEQRGLSLRKKLKWISEIFISFIRADSHMNWAFTDPLPSLKIYSRLFYRVGKRLGQTLNLENVRKENKL